MTTIAPAKRTERKRERTRAELVDAAEALVAERGLDAISIDDITEAADVAKGTFYTHFAGKTDLAAAIALRTRLELEEKITALNQGLTDAAQRMANGLSSMLAFAIANPKRARALIRLQPGAVDPEARINAGLRGDIVLGLKAKRFTAPSLDAAVVTTIGGALSGIMRVSEISERRAPAPFDLAAHIVEMLLVALGVKHGEAARLSAAALAARKQESKP